MSALFSFPVLTISKERPDVRPPAECDRIDAVQPVGSLPAIKALPAVSLLNPDKILSAITHQPTLHEGYHPMRKSPTISSWIRVFGLLAILVCLDAGLGFAQRKLIKQYVHQIWTANDGLPQNSASSIKQTRDGYIWFSTQDGLARFDGVDFTVFDRTNTKELPSSWMVRMNEDGAGGLWMRPIGFAPGVIRYYEGKFTMYDTTNGLPNNRVLCWETDTHGTTWLGTEGGLAEFNAGKFRTYTVRDGFPADSISGVRAGQQRKSLDQHLERTGTAKRWKDRDDHRTERIPRHDLPPHESRQNFATRTATAHSG